MHIRNGTSRNKRMNWDLYGTSFQIDQRSFAKIMGYITSFLEKINYYNTQNEVEGNWKKLVEKDPILYIVSIVNEPIISLDNIIELHKNQINNEYETSKTIAIIFDWYYKIEKWHKTLVALHEKKLAAKIENVLVEILKVRIEPLFELKTRNLAHMSAQKSEVTASPLPTYVPAPRNEIKNITDITEILLTFKKALIHIQEFTENYLEETIYSRNNHLPHNALYITFGVLFKTLQKKLNSLAQKHLDFYYQDILKQVPNKSQPTKTTVSFTLLPTIKTPSHIKKGTLLSAGKLYDSKTEILFKTDEELIAHNIKLVEMETLFFNSSPYIRVGTSTNMVSSISKNKLVTLQKDAHDTREDWFAFGANKESLQNTRINSDKIAPIGFIIGSPVLIMSEGTRSINIQVHLESSTAKTIFWKFLNQIKEHKKLSLQDTVSTVFEGGFVISYTTKNAWVAIDNYAISCNESENYFSIHLSLTSSDPALENYIAEGEQLKWPSIKVTLNPYAPIYLYSFLNGVTINSININVDVQNVQHVSLYNNLGKIPLGKPFDIFGPLPTAGSFLMLGKSELFNKNVTSAKLDLEWDSLPEDYGGFDTYYAGYSEPITNDSFKVQTAILNNGTWYPIVGNNTKNQLLFNTGECITPEGYESVKLSTTSSIVFNEFSNINIDLDTDVKDPLAYTITTPSGFIKLTLVSPSYGFGNDIYQKDYTEIATYNAQNKRSVPYPNKPFVPKISKASLSYTATDTLYFNIEDAKKNKGELMHIRPFFTEAAITGKHIIRHTLLPNYNQQGYLILGLSGVTDEPILSIFFHFLRSGSTNNILENNITWQYYSNNNWVDFNAKDMLKDDTHGLTKSGIIELRLPLLEPIEKVQEDLYWIRISTPKNAEHFPKIKGVYFNAVHVTCISNDPAIIGKNFKAQTIKKIAGKLPDVKSIIQPGSTFSGAPEETKDNFYRRVSERLRHKNRALSVWDYERLLLEKFDSIAVVKCTNLDKNFEPEPNEVKVVVLDSKWTNDERYYYKKATLDYMRDYLKSLTNTFVNIKVMNPTVEYLLVRCAVEFKNRSNAGYYLKQLNKDISFFLAPFNNTVDERGGIGGVLVPRTVSIFINNLEYIQSVENLSVEHIIRKRANDFSLGMYKDGQQIFATKPWSVFNPVKKHHLINKTQTTNDFTPLGFSTMEIGSDFILQKKPKPTLHAAEQVSTVEYPNDTILEIKSNP